MNFAGFRKKRYPMHLEHEYNLPCDIERIEYTVHNYFNFGENA
jgi:hypothetical protein